jgi:hypothetical protein
LARGMKTWKEMDIILHYYFSERRKCLESFKMWSWRRMGKIKWSYKITSELVPEGIGEKRALVNKF